METLSPLSVVNACAAVAYVALAIKALRRDRSAVVNRTFAGLCAAHAVWALGFGGMYSAGSREVAWAFDRFAAAGWAAFPAVSLHFCLRLASGGKVPRFGGRLLEALLYAPALVFWTRFQSLSIGSELDYVRLPLGWSPWLAGVSGWYALFQAYVVLSFAASLLVLLRWMRTTRSMRERRQAEVMVLTCAAMGAAGLIADQALEEWVGQPLPPLSPALGILWAAGIWYAMTRHQLLSLTPAVASEGILDTMSDLLFLVDGEGRIQDANRQALVALDRPREELIGREFAVVVGDAEAAKKTIAAMVDVGQPAFPLELAWVRRDGSRLPVWVSGSPIRDPSGDLIGCVVVGRDASERRRMEEELVRASRFESVGVIARGLAHEFNNQLTAIMGYLDLARTVTDPAHPARGFVEESLKAAEQARLLAQRMLSLGRGKAAPGRDVDVGRLVAEAAPVALRGSRTILDLRVEPDLPPVRVDESEVAQVLHILLINAREAMSGGGSVAVEVARWGGGARPEDDARHEDGARQEAGAAPSGGGSAPGSGEWVCITVRDTGPGIAPEHLPRLFEPFFSTKPGGSGLGLASCRSIVRNHGGVVTVESAPGRGATFRVYLPARTGGVVSQH